MTELEKQISFSQENKENCSDDSFCNCDLMSSYDLTCDCGEELDVHEWAWDETVASQATQLTKANREVRFHPGNSSGTAAVRGNAPFRPGHIYYWEIKMLTSLYGTDVMVGVGTKRAELDKSAYHFCSLLGSDKESWGFSYTGRLQHNGKQEWYGPPFGKGSIIGIRLDMWRGTLQFFLNRKPLGVAFRALGGCQALYPMVCSTAAQSAMRVIYSASHSVSLKLLSLQSLDDSTSLLRIPGLRNYLATSWWLIAGGWEECERSRKGGKSNKCRYHEVSRGGAKDWRGDDCPHQGGGRTRRLCLTCDIVL